MADELRRMEITDPRSLRALAHPLRLRLLGRLRMHGPLTATAAAELLGESAGSTSYHLRQLARHGLVEEVGRRGRARPWRATAHLTAVPTVTADAELSAASDVFRRVLAERYVELMVGWLDRRAAEPREWQEVAGFGDRYAYLTPAELGQLREEVERLIAPYEQRMLEGASRPPGARPVTIVNIAVPGPDPVPADRRR